MKKPIDLPGIRIITVSGRIGAGSTSLGKHLAETLGWRRMEGGDVFWEAIRKKMNVATKDTKLRPDEEDVLFEDKQKQILKEDKHIVLESKLAGFCAQGVEGVFKVGVICADESGDKTDIRIDRLVNRENIPVEDAKAEVLEREQNDLSKWRRLYAADDADWVYWDKKYYDLVVNTYSHNAEESLALVLETLGITEHES